MKKFTILALHLGVGGVEKAICSLANILSQKYDVEIISTYKILDKPLFELNPKIKVRYLMTDLKPNVKEFKEAVKKINVINIFKEGIKSIKVLYFRKKLMIDAIKKIDTDFIISTRYMHNNLVSKYAKKDIIKIAQEHNHHNGNMKYVKKVVSSCRGFNYFMPVSKELKDFYTKQFENTNIKCAYIPHCIDCLPEKISDLTNKQIISVGRLSAEKGYLDLIDVFNLVQNKYPDWNLKIAGDGLEKEKIQKKIKEYSLEKSVELLGFVTGNDLVNVEKQSSIYLMCSFEESFGIVLIEAESYGLPMIAFDSAQGAHEVIQNGVNGYLIENRDKEKMAECICKLIQDIELRKKLGNEGRKKSLEYTQEKISEKWFEFIEKIEK
ncbi:MAG: glycosyltransferase [Clostridia bacterium]